MASKALNNLALFQCLTVSFTVWPFTFSQIGLALKQTSHRPTSRSLHWLVFLPGMFSPDSHIICSCTTFRFYWKSHFLSETFAGHTEIQSSLLTFLVRLLYFRFSPWSYYHWPCAYLVLYIISFSYKSVSSIKERLCFLFFFFPLLFIQCLEMCLACSRWSPRICWMNELMGEEVSWFEDYQLTRSSFWPFG